MCNISPYISTTRFHCFLRNSVWESQWCPSIERYRKAGNRPWEDLAKSGHNRNMNINLYSYFYILSCTLETKYRDMEILILFFSLLAIENFQRYFIINFFIVNLAFFGNFARKKKGSSLFSPFLWVVDFLGFVWYYCCSEHFSKMRKSLWQKT